MTDQLIADYERALEAISAGHWDSARELLEVVPDDDGPKQFLVRNMAASNDRPPSGWDGAFSLANK